MGAARSCRSYFACEFGLSYADGNEIVSAVWPPSGLAVAAIVLFGRRVWPAIWIGAIAANATGDSTLAIAAGIATGNALAAVTAGALLGWAGFDPGLRRVRDVLALGIFAGGVATAINATIGVTVLRLGGVFEADGMLAAWRTWWLGDMAGVVLVAPAVLILARGFTGMPHRDRFAEGSLIALVLVLGTLFVLRDSITLAAPVFPVIILAALRFRQAGAVLSSLVAAAIIVAYTAAGNGPFVGGDPETDLLRAQLFVVLARAHRRPDRLHADRVGARRGGAGARRGQRARARRGAGARTCRQLGVGRRLGSLDLVGRDVPDRRTRARSEEALGYRAYLDIVHPEDREVVAGAVGVALETGEMPPFRQRVVRPDGSVRTADCRGRVVTDERARDQAGRHDAGRQRSAARPGSLPGAAGDGSRRDGDRRRARPDRVRQLTDRAPVRVHDRGADRQAGRDARADARPGGAPAHRNAFLEDPAPARWAAASTCTAREGRLRVPRRDQPQSACRPTRERWSRARSATSPSARPPSRRFEHQALHDPLTGLPNRVLFVDRLEHALARSKRTGSRLAVFFLDIDEFKNVNDSLGHEAGDLVLTALPPRLRLALRQTDTVARFGGDEFVILCEDLEAESDVTKIAGRLIDAFEQSIELEGREYHLSVSVGVVIVESGEAGAAAILRDADVAMYRAKGLGRGRFELFDARMRARVLERIQLESDLRRATGRGELEAPLPAGAFARRRDPILTRRGVQHEQNLVGRSPVRPSRSPGGPSSAPPSGAAWCAAGGRCRLSARPTTVPDLAAWIASNAQHRPGIRSPCLAVTR